MDINIYIYIYMRSRYTCPFSFHTVLCICYLQVRRADLVGSAPCEKTGCQPHSIIE